MTQINGHINTKVKKEIKPIFKTSHAALILILILIFVFVFVLFCFFFTFVLCFHLQGPHPHFFALFFK